MYVYNNVNLYIPCCNFIIKRLLHNRRLYFLLLLFAFSLGTPGLGAEALYQSGLEFLSYFR